MFIILQTEEFEYKISVCKSKIMYIVVYQISLRMSNFDFQSMNEICLCMFNIQKVKELFSSSQCRKTQAKSLVFSYISVKKTTLCTGILTWKVDIAHFCTHFTREKRPQINKWWKIKKLRGKVHLVLVLHTHYTY